MKMYEGVPSVKMFSFSSGVTVVFFMLPYLNILSISSKKSH